MPSIIQRICLYAVRYGSCCHIMLAGTVATSDISLLPGFLVLLMECIIGKHEYITLGKDHYFSPCHRFYGSRI